MGNKKPPKKRVMVQEKRKRKHNDPICYDCLDLIKKGVMKKGNVARILHRDRELCEAHFQERIGGPAFISRTSGKKFAPKVPVKTGVGVQNVGKLKRFLI